MTLALILVACATGRPAQDAGPDGDGAVSDASALLPFGADCNASFECESQLCIGVTDGATGTCTSACDAGCPAGYACSIEDIEGGEPTSVCVPAIELLCKSCDNADACGGQGNHCLEFPAGRFCASDCSNDPGVCPIGFSCQDVSDDRGSLGLLCVPDNGVCCVDADGDFRGAGDGCRAGDCDDTDAEIYDDAAEICDGKDNDCLNGADLEVTDCGKAECKLGSSGYYMRASEPCLTATCEPQPQVPCGLYACENGGDDGDVCATSCDGEDDAKCASGAHCESSACEADRTDGMTCDENSDCVSEHCENGFCCAFGDCCAQASDCPSFGTFEPVCEDPATCQGSRGDAVCTAEKTCATTGDVADDSACTTATVANSCGYYLPVLCTGALSQTAPSCPTSCSGNQDCDANGYCDPGTSACVADKSDGETCAGDSQCSSGHCQNGFCCATGDCCQSASDCPASYASPPSCTVQSACQGQRDAAECVAFSCNTVPNSPDDSACTTAIEADDCGPYLSRFCNGAVSQNEPPCATSCAGDQACDVNAYCNTLGQCEFDEPNGSVCLRDSQCTSGHCENGFCCATGDCCADSGDCDHLSQAAVCDSQTSCQGSRVDGVCNGNFECTTQNVADDSACAALTANTCGAYPSVTCTSATTQPSNQAALCTSSCGGDNDCDLSAHCEGIQCVADQGQGGFCDDPSDCGAGLSCVDNVCCGSACSGSCSSCDVAGSEGTCTLITDGQDPDAECGLVDCDNYYWGWLGDSCYRKADVSAAAATCGGNGACGSVAEECSAQATRGGAAVTCDDVCQSPNASTCTGTTAGQCTNLNLGTESCGQGVCSVTVNRCVNGVEQTCVPNSAASTSETCDGLDNDCDGNIDDGLPIDSYELNETCASHAYLGVLYQDNSSTYSNMTLYSSGDVDWYRQLTSELGGTCTAGVDETYEYQVTMTPPDGKDYDLQVCYNSYTNASCTSDCFSSVKGGDQTESITLGWAGPCGGTTNDGLNFFIRVYPFGSASSCEPYTLTTTFTKTN